MEETIVPANDCDLIPLVTLKNYPKQSFCIVYFICDHLLNTSLPFENLRNPICGYMERSPNNHDSQE
jgi:hypothetical protein